MKIGEFEAFALNSPEYQMNFINLEASRTLEQLASIKVSRAVLPFEVEVKSRVESPSCTAGLR